jgi:hypothetical protein
MATLKNTTINDTGYLKLPTGTDAQRPASPEAGMMRWNTTSSSTEVYDGTAWSSVGGSSLTANDILTCVSSVDGAGSGLDADKLDGLELHTGRNNEANKVVRTDGNGYIQAGWINTLSGATTSTLARVYASNDCYIRYYTPANFASQISPYINVSALKSCVFTSSSSAIYTFTFPNRWFFNHLDVWSSGRNMIGIGGITTCMQYAANVSSLATNASGCAQNVPITSYTTTSASLCIYAGFTVLLLYC